MEPAPTSKTKKKSSNKLMAKSIKLSTLSKAAMDSATTRAKGIQEEGRAPGTRLEASPTSPKIENENEGATLGDDRGAADRVLRRRVQPSRIIPRNGTRVGTDGVSRVHEPDGQRAVLASAKNKTEKGKEQREPGHGERDRQSGGGWEEERGTKEEGEHGRGIPAFDFQRAGETFR